MSEFELIAGLGPFLAGAGDGVLVGHGDDAAVVAVGERSVCVTVDVLVEDVHFRRDLSSLADVGWKAVAVNVSDVAAMGGRPSVAVVGLCRPPVLPVAEVAELYAGMHEACQAYKLRLVGGDTVAADALAVSVTVLGDVTGKGVRRSGARPGHRLVVVGALGGAASALAALAAGLEPDPALLDLHRRPRALVEAGAALAARGATAMIDLSDGLGADLGHICAASGVRARIDAAALPIASGVDGAVVAADLDRWRVVCGGGEDFALLAALPAEVAEQAAAEAGAADGVPAAVIGEVLEAGEGPAAVLVTADGERDLAGLGYDHFSAEA